MIEWINHHEPLIVFGILLVEIIDFAFTRWENTREFYFDKGLVEKKKKPIKPKEVVLAPIPEKEDEVKQ